MLAHSDKDASREMVPISRFALLVGYGAAVFALLLVEACDLITEPLVEFRAPTFEFRNLPIPLFFAALICAGLCCADLRCRKPFSVLGPAVAYITATYVMSVLALSVFAAWIDFTNRVGGYRELGFTLPKALEDFFDRHDPLNPFGLGFWALMTPPALVALPIIIGLFRCRNGNARRLTERLAVVILSAAAGCGAFLLGSVIAETRFPTSLLDVGLIAFSTLPVVVLGALSTLVTRRLFMPPEPRKARPTPHGKIDLGKVLSSASQTSVVTLLLLYLGISQISGYANQVSELIEAREAFAFDVVNASVLDFNSSASDSNGRLISKTAILTSIPWGDVSVIQDPRDTVWYWVEVAEALTKEKWSARSNHQPGDAANHTKEIADREGVAYKDSENAIKIYPRIEKQLRAKEVAFPDTGLSLNLSSFTLLVPFVVFAALVLLGDRARAALHDYARPDDPWILLDADRGLTGLLAWLWLGALAFGPWLLAVLVVETTALMLRAKGAHETFLLDGIATAYIALVLVLLLVSACSATKNLLMLRSLARESKH
jgi:hypothetical protein